MAHLERQKMGHFKVYPVFLMESIESQCGYPEGLACSDVFIKVHDAKFINVECGNEFSLGVNSGKISFCDWSISRFDLIGWER